MGVSRGRNRALYHSDGFGLFVEIESMSRLFFSWCCVCDSEQDLLPRGIETSSGFFFILTHLRPGLPPKSCFVRQTTSSPLIFLPPLGIYISYQTFPLQVLNLLKYPNAQFSSFIFKLGRQHTLGGFSLQIRDRWGKGAGSL